MSKIYLINIKRTATALKTGATMEAESRAVSERTTAAAKLLVSGSWTTATSMSERAIPNNSK